MSKNVVEQIKGLLKEFGFMDEVTLLSFKLADNTIVEAESLEVGKSIMKINEAFEKVSLENGSYKLNNFEVEVENGLIKSVKELFVDAKLVDGTVIKVEGDSLLEGAKVFVVQGDAEVVAPDGVHELEDGTKVETKDGMIVSVSEKEVEAPEVEIEVPLAASQPPSMEKELMEMLQDFVKKVGEKMTAMEQNYNTLQNEFNQFKKEPASKKITDGKTDYKFNVENGELNNKIKAIMALRNK
jgi:hypothetical protein